MTIDEFLQSDMYVTASDAQKKKAHQLVADENYDILEATALATTAVARVHRVSETRVFISFVDMWNSPIVHEFGDGVVEGIYLPYDLSEGYAEQCREWLNKTPGRWSLGEIVEV